MTVRAPISQDVQTEVLTRSVRRCALCYGLSGSLEQVKGQIAHLDRDNTNASVANLAFLCFVHHDEYDSKTSQSKGMIPRELEFYRDRLYEAIARNEHHRGDVAATARTRIDEGVIAHDKDKFAESDALLDESTLRGVAEYVGTEHAYHDKYFDQLNDFVRFFTLETNQYVIRELRDATKTTRESLENLLDFLAKHFFEYPEKQKERGDLGYRYCLYPDLNVDRGGSGEGDEYLRYSKHATRLHEVLDNVECAYADYRRAIKVTLLI